MKLLLKESIRTCSDLDEAIHQAETDRIMEVIFSMSDYDCEIDVTFEDDYYKKMNLPLYYESNLHRIMDVIEMRDIKNGVDTLVTNDNHLAFRTYGENYTHEGKEGILTSLVVVRCYGEGRVSIDMSGHFATVSQSEIGLNKEESCVADFPGQE